MHFLSTKSLSKEAARVPLSANLDGNPCHPRVSLTFHDPHQNKQLHLRRNRPAGIPHNFSARITTFLQESVPRIRAINEIFSLRNPLIDGGTKTTLARRNLRPPGYCLHLIQRGNYRQTVFSSDADREHFLSLLETHSEERGVRIAAYTFMSNHFHLVAAGPEKPRHRRRGGPFCG